MRFVGLVLLIAAGVAIGVAVAPFVIPAAVLAWPHILTGAGAFVGIAVCALVMVAWPHIETPLLRRVQARLYGPARLTMAPEAWPKPSWKLRVAFIFAVPALMALGAVVRYWREIVHH